MLTISLWLIACLSACATLVTSTVALGVASHAEIQARRNARYTVLSPCMLERDADAYAISERIREGGAVSEQENRILNTLEPDAEIPPFPSYQVAYAFAVIAARLEDARAIGKREEYLATYPPGELEEVEETIHYKYYESYLQKCFTVPQAYHLYVPVRENFRHHP